MTTCSSEDISVEETSLGWSGDGDIVIADADDSGKAIT